MNCTKQMSHFHADVCEKEKFGIQGLAENLPLPWLREYEATQQLQAIPSKTQESLLNREDTRLFFSFSGLTALSETLTVAVC